MSRTPAMTTARRLEGYGARSYPAGCTPAQRRRIDHKNGHARARRQEGRKPAKVASVEQPEPEPERMTADAIVATVSVTEAG